MVERLAVGVADDEARIALALRPVERERDLVGTALHHCGRVRRLILLRVALPDCGGGAPAAAAAVAEVPAACPEFERILTDRPGDLDRPAARAERRGKLRRSSPCS